MPAGRLLVGVPDAQHGRLVEGPADHLEPDRQAGAVEAAGQGEGREARQVDRDGTWSPIGRPAPSKPQGRARAGRPARLTEMVKMSDRYMVSGSAVFSPRRKAVVGATGVTSASQRASACWKSRRMSVRTCCAFR